MSDTATTTDRSRLVRLRVELLVVAVLVVAAYVVGTRYPHTTEITSYCDTTQESVRCEVEHGLRLPVSDVGPWQDASHTWRTGRPDCLEGSGEDIGPVTLGVVDGGDDGMAWRQVVWVACPP